MAVNKVNPCPDPAPRVLTESPRVICLAVVVAQLPADMVDLTKLLMVPREDLRPVPKVVTAKWIVT